MALRDNDPREIGGYALLDRLGAGGMGTVFLARAESGRPVALKVVHEQFAADAEFRTRFRQEIRAARRVSGAFTAPVVDADPDAARPWMATTYVPGRTLRSRVEAEGPLSGAELRLLAVGLVEALRDMHQVRVIHRDLKPDNVLLTEDGPRVIDFGISRAADHQTLTVTGRILGTPPFMSPEQLSAPHRVTPASDVFSLGAVLVYATTGRGPFDAGSPYMTAYNVVHEPPEVAELSGTVREIVQWCLSKEPGERPGPEDLLSAFRQAPEEEWGARPGPRSVDGNPPPPVASAEASRPRPRRRRPLTTLAVAVALVAGTGGYVAWQKGARLPGATGASQGSGSASPTAKPARLPAASVLSSDGAYLPVLGGDPGGTSAYSDSPARRPTGWHQWKGGAGAGPCVFAASSLLCASRPGLETSESLVRLNAADGKKIWATSPHSAANGSSPVVVEETVVTFLADAVVGFALADGKRLWKIPMDAPVASLTADTSRVYVVDVYGAVSGVDVAGRQVAWQRATDASNGAGTRLRVTSGLVHLISPGGRMTSMRAKDGGAPTSLLLDSPCLHDAFAATPLHRLPLAYVCGSGSPTTGGGAVLARAPKARSGTYLPLPRDGSLVVADKRLLTLAPSGNGTLLAEVDPQGGTRWQTRLPLLCEEGAPPAVVTGRRLYLACRTRGVVVDLATHEVASRFDLPAGTGIPVESDLTPLVAGGVLFVPGSNHWVSVDPYAAPA
ncbi:protein kinase [Streptomyces sp. NPDC050842]|uniref:serine/threonine-protein kinase n=1 Tax=Streptomyces sp. NPDC050842 TaxID=3365636 RepID=UPI0037A993BA